MPATSFPFFHFDILSAKYNENGKKKKESYNSKEFCVFENGRHFRLLEIKTSERVDEELNEKSLAVLPVILLQKKCSTAEMSVEE